jgi:DNA-binding response OmpR family regulator
VPKHRLAGRFILLIEDEPLIALDVERVLRAAGARVVAAGYLESALYTTEHPALSAAVVDLRLGDSNSMSACRRLRHLQVPFVVHTAYPAVLVASEWPEVPVIVKPADPEQIVNALVSLLG